MGSKRPRIPLQTAHCKLSTANRLLQTAHCPLLPVWAMTAAAPTALAAFEQKMLGENPISFFKIIIYTLHQRFGLRRCIFFIAGRHAEGNAFCTQRFIRPTFSKSQDGFLQKKCGRNLASVRILCRKAMPFAAASAFGNTHWF